MRLWEKLSASCTIEEFKHTELEPTSHINAPPPAKMETFFADAPSTVREPEDSAPSHVKEEAARLTAFLHKIDKVRTDKEFVGRTPKTSQDIRAEGILLRDMHEHGRWHQVDDACNAGLLPEGGLVVSALGQASFVVKAYPAAALLWPATQLEIGMWDYDMEVTELVWATCYNINDFKQIPLVSCSPLRLFVQDVSYAVSIFVLSCTSLAQIQSQTPEVIVCNAWDKMVCNRCRLCYMLS